MTSYAKVGKVIQLQPVQLGTWDEADIGVSRFKEVGTARRNFEPKVKDTPLRTVDHSPDKGHGIEEADCADAKSLPPRGSGCVGAQSAV
jgi:hypothetical protein